jgi:hypothetical protein
LVSWKPRQIANSGMPRSSTSGISGSVHSSRCGSSGSSGLSTSSPKWLGCTFDGEPVNSTPSARSSHSSISPSAIDGTISGRQPASLTASMYFLPAMWKGWCPTRRLQAGTRTTGLRFMEIPR